MDGTVFEARGLCRRFRKKRALDDFDLSLRKGTVTVLLGPNGAGKTTLMRLAMGLMKPSAGSLRVLGYDPIDKPVAVRQRVGYVPSLPDVYGWMSVDRLFAFLKPQYPTWNDALARETARMLDVPMDVPYRALSLGQAMKGLLAAALAPEPELLLLDEPFSNLDPLAREEVLRGVLAPIRGEGRSVLCATHDLDVASRLADRVAVIAQGRLKKEGSLEEVLGMRTPTRIPEGLLDLLRDSAGKDEASSRKTLQGVNS